MEKCRNPTFRSLSDSSFYVDFVGERLTEDNFKTVPRREELPYRERPLFYIGNKVYVFDQQISYGAYGLVDRVFCDGTPYAVKWEIVPQGESSSLAREFKFMQMLRSLDCVPQVFVHDFTLWRKNIIFFIIMEYFPGRTLYKVMESPHTDKLSMCFALDIVQMMVYNLYQIHSLGVVHGDLHPGNCMVGDIRWNLKFLDFGLSSENGEVAGVPQVVTVYNSPEILLAFSSKSPLIRVFGDDWWSLALISIQLFDDVNAIPVLKAHREYDDGPIVTGEFAYLRTFHESLLRYFCDDEAASPEKGPVKSSPSPMKSARTLSSLFSSKNSHTKCIYKPTNIMPSSIRKLIQMIFDLRDETEADDHVAVQNILNYIHQLKGVRKAARPPLKKVLSRSDSGFDDFPLSSVDSYPPSTCSQEPVMQQQLMQQVVQPDKVLSPSRTSLVPGSVFGASQGAPAQRMVSTQPKPIGHVRESNISHAGAYAGGQVGGQVGGHVCGCGSLATTTGTTGATGVYQLPAPVPSANFLESPLCCSSCLVHRTVAQPGFTQAGFTHPSGFPQAGLAQAGFQPQSLPQHALPSTLHEMGKFPSPPPPLSPPHPHSPSSVVQTSCPHRVSASTTLTPPPPQDLPTVLPQFEIAGASVPRSCGCECPSSREAQCVDNRPTRTASGVNSSVQPIRVRCTHLFY